MYIIDEKQVINLNQVFTFELLRTSIEFFTANVVHEFSWVIVLEDETIAQREYDNILKALSNADNAYTINKGE